MREGGGGGMGEVRDGGGEGWDGDGIGEGSGRRISGGWKFVSKVPRIGCTVLVQVEI